MKSFKSFIFNVSPVLVIIAVFAILECAVVVFHIPNYILPAPTASFKYILTGFGEMWPHLWKTFSQYLIGFPLGSFVGFVLAMLFILNKTASKAVSPYLTVIFCTPQIILIPLLKIWLGYEAMVSMIICVLSCFSAIMTQIMTGAEMIPEERFELVEACKGNKLQVFFHIIVPSCWSSTFTGLKLGAIAGLAGVVGAEMIGDMSGIGYIVKLNTSIYQITEMFAYVYVLMAFGYIVYRIICIAEEKLVKQ